MREAIDKSNIVRLRSGSPGHQSRVKMEFSKEMANLGLQKDVMSITQTKNELAARSVDQNPEITPPKQPKAYLPFQRRMRSASPPLKICSENYIVYS